MANQYFRILRVLFIFFMMPPVYNVQAQNPGKGGPSQPIGQTHVLSDSKKPFIIPYRNGRRLDIESASPIQVVGSEQIQQTFNLKDVTETINYIPGTHVATTRSSKVTIRGGTGGLDLIRRDVLILVNGRKVTHAQSTITDINNIPISAIEQIEVLKDGAGVVYGPDAESGVINIITKPELDNQFSGGIYNPVYPPPKIDYKYYTNELESPWNTEVKGVFSGGETSGTRPDNTYGMGGSLKFVTTRNDDFIIQQTRYFDANNNLRQLVDKEYYPEGYMSIEDTRYNCFGNSLFSSHSFTDQFGYNYSLSNTRFTNGKPAYSYRDLDASLNPLFRQYFNTEKLEYRLNDTYLGLNTKIKDFYSYQYVPDYDACKEEAKTSADDVFTIGITFRLEDYGGSRETFIGPNATYTHFFNPNLGATADVGFNFKSDNNWKINVFTAFGGITYVPFDEKAGLDDKFTFSAHALAGFNSVTQKFGGNSYSDGNFAIKAGIAGDIMFNDRLGLRLGFDDIIVPQKNNTTNNFVITGALRMDF